MLRPSRSGPALACALLCSLALIVAGCGATADAGSTLDTGVGPDASVTGLPSTSSTAPSSTPSPSTAPPSTVTSSTRPTSSTAPPSTRPTSTAPPSSTSSAPPATTGVDGHVTATPSCAVERVDQPCPPLPVAARIEARDAAATTVASTDSDATGHYQLALAPGRYTLTATTGTIFPRCNPTEITVGAGAPTSADIGCDTGIR